MRLFILMFTLLAGSAIGSVHAAETPPFGGLLKPVPITPGQTQFTGWLRHRGEILLYDTERSLKERRKAPHCVSGRPTDSDLADFSKFEGQRVTITGKLVDYESLPDDGEPVLPRKVLGGASINNYCFGDRVLLIESIKPELVRFPPIADIP